MLHEITCHNLTMAYPALKSLSQCDEELCSQIGASEMTQFN